MTLLFHHDRSFIFQRLKTREYKRLISMGSKMSVLNKWRIRQDETYLAGKGYLENNKVVLDCDGGSPMWLAYPAKKLAALIKKHDLHKITILGLRHYTCFPFIWSGSSIKEVQERLDTPIYKWRWTSHVTDCLREQTAEKFQRYIEIWNVVKSLCIKMTLSTWVKRALKQRYINVLSNANV